jgi:hypothetical protein
MIPTDHMHSQRPVREQTESLETQFT